jgi:hypothetical protein
MGREIESGQGMCGIFITGLRIFFGFFYFAILLRFSFFHIDKVSKGSYTAAEFFFDRGQTL